MLRSLLQSLAGTQCLRQVLVVDNGLDAETESVCRHSPVPARYVRPARNMGCGGGVAHGLRLGLSEPGITHFCLFDDDAEASPGAIDELIDGMVPAEADIAVPLVLNAQGYIAWYPGLLEAHAWEVIRRPQLTAEGYAKVCGINPVRFTWAPWPVMALSARGVRECGYPRDDFWLSAEDLEYSLRLTHRFKGVLVPSAVCIHRPPSAREAANMAGGAHYLRFCLMLQNLSYIGTRLPHARRVLRHLPGNYLRFLRTFGASAASMRDAGLAFWRGAGLGKPAGHAGADGFKQRFLQMSKRSDHG